MSVISLPVSGMSASSATARTRLRITRRGRIVLAAFVSLLVLGVVVFGAVFGAAQAQASSESSQQEFGYLVVQPGDSLWQISSGLDPKADPRDLISEIVRLNQLGASDVEVGQTLAVPLRFSDNPSVVKGSGLVD